MKHLDEYMMNGNKYGDGIGYWDSCGNDKGCGHGFINGNGYGDGKENMGSDCYGNFTGSGKGYGHGKLIDIIFSLSDRDKLVSFLRGCNDNR